MELLHPWRLAQYAVAALTVGFVEERHSSFHCLPFSPLSQLHYQYEVVKQLHELWRQHMMEEKVPLGQTSVEDIRYQESIAEGPSAQSSITEILSQRNSLKGALSQMLNVEEKEPAPSGWNLSLEDFKQVVACSRYCSEQWWCFHFPTARHAAV